ncbi:hypothetical protein GF325_05915 [Candidatus Bathyarchaeota archaeon]|nr:hypothetical protein [Candidatus Bathyarchaeota archaeon]
MLYCPKCDNILIIKRKGKAKDKKARKKVLFCPSCGYEAPFEEKDKKAFVLAEKLEKTGKEKTAILLNGAVNDKLTEEEREAYEWLFEGGGD